MSSAPARNLLAAIAAGLAWLGVGASAASAATVSVVPTGLLENAVRFEDSTGETNRVSLRLQGSSLIVEDTGSALTPGLGCSAWSASTVECATTGVTSLQLELGAGDDVLQRPFIPMTLPAALAAAPGTTRWLHPVTEPT